MNQEAIAIVQKCLDTQDPYLDLGSLGLSDEDFAEGTELDGLLRQCSHLETLVLSNNWWQWDADGKWREYESRNTGGRNHFATHPPALAKTSGLLTLVMAGEIGNKWGISDMGFVAGLKGLQQLNISYNQISEIRGLEGLSALQQLDLTSNQISKISGLEGLSALQELDLSSNQISEISGLEGLSALRQLDLSSNQISEIKGLEGLSALQQLDLSSNKIGEISWLEGLSALQQLDLSSNKIGEISGLEGLSALQQLSIGGNQISEIKGLEGLSALQQLSIGGNQISEISGLEGLSALQELRLYNNQISEISGLEGLSALQELYLSSNQISEISGLEHLTALEKLEISNNKISNISGLLPWLKRTANPLQIVLKVFPPHKVEKGELNVYGNPLTTPPISVVKKGNEAVLRYFEKIAKEGQDYIYEAKLILVGEGSAGKTSLQVRLQDAKAKLPKQDKRTRGIQIADWPFKTSKGRPHIAHIWDFGGQDVYYPVHRFFLTENAVFVLLASTRQTTHNFDYWIPTIFQFGGKSPIILGQTCHDGNKVAWNDLGFYMGSDNFNIIKTGALPYQELNLVNKNEGLVKIKKTIVEQLTSLPHYGKGVPKTWVTVRDKIAAMAPKTACIPFSKFKELCRAISSEGFADAVAVDDCAGFLHSIGVVLWYADIAGLKDWVVLQPEWAMKAVYKIIDDADIQKRRGIILAKDFKRLWSEGCYEGMHDVLKQMLEVFKIAFPKKHPKGDYIIPARLLSMPAEARWQIAEPCLRLEYKYEFMPRGMVNQLSAELSRYIIADEQVWNDAVNFKNNDASCQVTEDFYNRFIRIFATGKDARALVMLVMNGLQDITDGYRGVTPQIIVPCTCKKCEKSSKPITFEYDRLLEWSKEREQVTCNNSGETLRIDDLLYHVGLRNPEKEKNTNSKNKTIKVFLASSAELKEDREKFEIFINRENKRLNEQGIFIELNLWEDFIDAMSQTRLQDEYNKVVRGCDIFVSLFFTKVGKYTAEEFEQAFGQFQATGKPYVYTYFKDEYVKIDKLNKPDMDSKFEFQEKLKALGHFPTTYSNIDNLKFQFKAQLEKLLPGL